MKLITGVGVLVALLVAAAAAAAHDFWLVPNAFHVADGGELTVKGQTSSRFPTSEVAVTPDRVAEARVIAASTDERVAIVATEGTSLMLQHRPRGVGQRIVVVTVAPRSLRASGPEFKRYMELEGAAELAARYERQGLLPRTDSITRRYAKYAKTIVDVGSGGPRAFSRIAGQVAEFVPLHDPATLRAGDTLSVRLLYRGLPLAEAHVHAGQSAADGATDDLSLVTDANGLLRVPLAAPGLWNVRTIHIAPSDRGSGADWDSHFVTMVFSVGAAHAGDSSHR